MKSIERRFLKIVSKNPGWSSYICFAEAIRGQSFKRETIKAWFNKLVDKNDYDKKEKRSIISDFTEFSNSAEDTPKPTQTKP